MISIAEDNLLKPAKIINTHSQKNIEMKNRIFDVALHLMKKVEFNKLTIRNICTNAGISIGMFYRNFESKDALLFYYYERISESYYNQVYDTLKDKNLDEQLLTLYTWISEFNVYLGLDFCRYFFDSHSIVQKKDYIGNQVVDISNKYIEAAVEKGYKLKYGRTPMEVTRDLCIIIKGVTFDWCIHEGNYDLVKYTNEFLKRIMKNLI